MAQIPDAEVQLEVGEIKPQKWEYKITKFDVDSNDHIGRIKNEAQLDLLGEDGWEVFYIRDNLVYLKRPIWNPE